MNNEILLLSKNDIPFPQAQVNIHNPTIEEISPLGEESFHIGCQFLNFSLNDLSEEDKTGLEDKSDFEVFMSIMLSKEKVRYKIDAQLVLSLIFPDYHISFSKDAIILEKDYDSFYINEKNFNAFKDLLSSMFCLEEDKAQEKYNPANKMAERIANKLKKREQQLAKKSTDKKHKIAIFSRYISILAVGEHKDINELMNYTVYQLNDEFKRFQKKQTYDMYIKAKMAGATDLDDVDNWMEDIHP